MKHTLLSITAGVLFSTVALAAQAMPANIGVVDMKAIFESAPQVKAINAKLKKQFKPKQDDIVHKAQALQADIKLLEKNKTVLSKSKLSALQDKIAREESVVRTEQMQYRMAVQKEQGSLMKSFIADVTKAVKTVSTKQRLELVLPSNATIYSANKLDITNQVLSQLK